jgi:hypothetical protein
MNFAPDSQGMLYLAYLGDTDPGNGSDITTLNPVEGGSVSPNSTLGTYLNVCSNTSNCNGVVIGFSQSVNTPPTSPNSSANTPWFKNSEMIGGGDVQANYCSGNSNCNLVSYVKTNLSTSNVCQNLGCSISQSGTGESGDGGDGGCDSGSDDCLFCFTTATIILCIALFVVGIGLGIGIIKFMF